MSLNPSPELKSLFQAALDEFEKKSGINLVQHQISNKLMTCETVASVIDILQDQTTAFRNSQADDHGKLMKWINRIVKILHTLSTNNILVGSVGLAFPPAKAVFSGIAILLSKIKDVSASYGALLDLFESFESFLGRLDVYTKIPLTAAMTEIVVKILIELLSTISLAIQHVKQGRLKRFGNKLLGENEIGVVLKRLDRLTLDEARMTATETLEVVYGLVKNMKVVMDDGRLLMDDVHRALMNLQQLTNEINKRGRDELQEKVRRWLSPPDPSINHNSARKAHHEGSAEWFLHGNTFPQWKATIGSLLWIRGKPGSGKTILSSSIIEDLSRSRKAGLASIAFFYFDFKDESKKYARGALSSLLVQLAAQSDAYSEILSELYSEHDAGSRQPSEYALRECFTKMLILPDQGPIYIVFDAIDECPNSTGTPSTRQEVLSLVKWLSALPSSRLSICITSRPEADIEIILQSLAYHTVSLHSESGQKSDIANYIKWFVDSDPSAQKWRKEDKEYVVEKLSERADGMFRWIFCQLDRLRRCLPARIRKVLDELPATLDETYERTLLDIDEENWSYAHRLFQCLVVAFRPLCVKELAEFLAFEFEEEGTTTFRVDWRSEDPSHAVLFTCSSLIAVVYMEGSAIVEFSHFSVKEYLTSTRIAKGRVPRYYIPLEPPHTLVTQACLSILLQLDDHMTKERIKDFPLAEYAAQYWVKHAKMKNVLSDTEDPMRRLFDPKKLHFATWIWIYNIDNDYHLITLSPTPPSTTPLYFAALCGLYGVAEWLVTTCSQDVNAQGGRFSTPLHAASAMGSFGVVQLLLGHNAHVNFHGRNNRTPLHDASKAGQVMTCRLLLDWGADIDAIDIHGKTPLFMALEYGPLETSMEAAELLLGRGADPNFKDKYGRSPIYVALSRNLLDVAKVLCKHGANPNAKDNNGRTLLHSASALGQSELAQQLLCLGVDANARDSRGRTPLQVMAPWIEDDLTQPLLEHGADPKVRHDNGHSLIHVALERGNLKAAHQLRLFGANINLQYEHGRTPLHVLVARWKQDVAERFLAYGANPNAVDDDGETPLHLALRGRKLKVAQALSKLGSDLNWRNNQGRTVVQVAKLDMEDVLLLVLEYGADPHVQYNDGQTPLQMALGSGKIEVVQRLLTLGVDVNSHDNRGKTPLQIAQYRSDEILLLLLLDNGADPNVQDDEGQTLLHMTSESGTIKVIQRLLTLGVDVNALDNRGRTPLQVAQSESEDVLLLLLDHGADPNVQDDQGWTPLHFASRFGNRKVTQRLLELGAHVDSRNNQGQTPLHISWRSEDVTRLLLGHNARPGIRDKDGKTPLHVASQEGKRTVVEWLLELGVDVNSRDNRGQTPLHSSISRWNDDIPLLLLNHSAEPDARDEDGQTPLHVASRKGSLKVAERLLELDVDVNSRDSQGHTPLYVVFPLSWRMVELLLKHGAVGRFSLLKTQYPRASQPPT